MKTLRTLLLLSIGYGAGVAAPALATGLEKALTPQWEKTSPGKFSAVLNADKWPNQVPRVVTATVDASKRTKTTYGIAVGDTKCTVIADDGNAIGLVFYPGSAVEDMYSIATIAGSPLEKMLVTRFKDTPSTPPGAAR